MTQPQSVKESLPGLWRIARYFWPHVRPHRALAVVSLMGLFAEIGLRLLEPWPLKVVFDRVLNVGPPKRSWLLPGLQALGSMRLLGLAALAVVAITALRAGASYWQTIGFAKIGSRVLRTVRERLYRHVQYLSLSFHTTARTGDLVMRIINDVGLLQDVAVTAILPVAARLLIVGGMVGLMFALNWKLALLAISVVPLFALRTASISRRIREVAKKQRRVEGAMAATVAESMSAIRTVQALSLEEKFAASFASESQRTLKQDVKGKRLSATLERTVDVLIALATALVLWFGARLVLRGEISSGDLLVFLAYLKSGYRPMQDFAKYTGRLAKASAAGERVIDLLERVPDVRDQAGAVRAPAFRGRVQFEDVSFAYATERVPGSGFGVSGSEPAAAPGPRNAESETRNAERPERPVLDGVTLDILPGQRVALVGPSGGGKSTLVSLVLRLYEPQRGRVLIDGQDIRQFTLESLRAQISVVLQDNLLFAGTVRDNIACAAAGATWEQIEAAARLACAHEFIQGLPKGYDTSVGERGVTLSHGQRQRIAIARAAIRRAPILILDEPTTGLDKRSERAVLDALENVHLQCTTFLITHDLRQAAGADVVLYLEGGRLVETGPPAELLRRNGPYATLFHLHTQFPKTSAADPAPAEFLA